MAPHDETNTPASQPTTTTQPTTAQINHNQCVHVWAAYTPEPGAARYQERCGGCGARCTRDASRKIVEYDRGVKLPDHRADRGDRSGERGGDRGDNASTSSPLSSFTGMVPAPAVGSESVPFFLGRIDSPKSHPTAGFFSSLS